MFLSDALQHTQYRAPPVSSSGNIVAKPDHFTNLHLLLEPSIWFGLFVNLADWAKA